MDAAWAIVIAGAIAGCTSVLSPIIISTATMRQRREDRAEDRADRELVASKVDAAALQAKRTAALLVQSNEAVAETAKVQASKTNAALQQIHVLVNSDKTEALQALLDQTKLTLLTLREVVSLCEEARRNVPVETLAAIETAEVRIREMEANLVERAAQMKIIDTKKPE